MNLQRLVVGSQSSFFPNGAAFTELAAGTASPTACPDVSDPAWIPLGAIKWSKSPKSKTEEYMEASPGAYVQTDEVVLSKGLVLKGKLEKQSNLAYQLALAAATTAGAALPLSPAAGGVFGVLTGSPVLKGWLQVLEYSQANVLINTVYYFVALKASGDTNNDDKAAETPIEATVLYSTLNKGTLT